MFSLIGRLGRADCYLLIVIAGCANLVAAEQSVSTLRLSLTCYTAQAVTLRMAQAIRQKFLI